MTVERRQGTALIAMMVVLLVIDMIAVGVLLSTARTHASAVERTAAVQAFYAAEAGTQMATRDVRSTRRRLSGNT